MAVTVDHNGLLAGASGADTCPFVLAGAEHPDGLDALVALVEALERIDARAQHEWLDADGQSLSGGRPDLGPRGPVAEVYNDAQQAELTVAYLHALAADLSDIGWSGRLEPRTRGSEPAPPLSVTLTMVLAPLGWGQMDARRIAVPTWRADSAATSWLVPLGTGWLDGLPGQDHLRLRGAEEAVTREEREHLVRRALGDPEARLFLDVDRSAPGAFRQVRYLSRGHVLLVGREPLRLLERLDALTSYAAAWAERLGHAWLAGSGADPEQGVAEDGRQEHLGEEWLAHRDHDLDRLPDAFAWQLVTGRHLDRAHDLSRWRIDRVAEDRYALAHPDPRAWFEPHPDPPPWARGPLTRPDPEVLASARADLGDLILRD